MTIGPKPIQSVKIRLLFFFLLAAGLFPPSLIGADPVAKTGLARGEYSNFQPNGDIRRFDGESLFYDIGFLWFKKAATSQIRFFKKEGRYQAELTFETKGVVGWFTSYRKHIYKSTFEIIDQGSRVRTAKFQREVIIGDETEQTVNNLDYQQGINRWVKYKNRSLALQKEEPIPNGIIQDDILAAFYNFRNGVYGTVKPGAAFTIHTIPEKGFDKMSVKVMTEKETRLEEDSEEWRQPQELLLDIKIPKEIFKTKTGNLFIWGSKHLVPTETTVKDYVALGDLQAVFNRREFTPSTNLAVQTLSSQ